MNPEHQILLNQLRGAARPISSAAPQNDSYGGSGQLFYNVSVPARRSIAKAWLATHRALSPTDVLAVVESLFKGESHEEKTLAAIILGYSPEARTQLRPGDLDRWLGQVNGWAEVDCLCHNQLTAAELMSAWPAWKGLIERLSRSLDINRRRAALVLLNGPVHYSDDRRFLDLALATVEVLKTEKAILITKAISWLLRSAVARHRREVETYLAGAAASLPKVAVRETTAKLATGTKSGRSRSR